MKGIKLPYIRQDERDALIDALSLLCVDMGEIGFTEGQLNYVFTTLLLNFLGDVPRYSDYNSAIGILECCKLELYRRRTAVYEDECIKRNGDL